MRIVSMVDDSGQFGLSNAYAGSPTTIRTVYSCLLQPLTAGMAAPGFTGKPLLGAFAGEHALAAFAGV